MRGVGLQWVCVGDRQGGLGMVSTIAERLEGVRASLAAGVTLVVVTKYATIEQMVAAFEAGVRDFGENKIQDVDRKQAELPAHIVTAVNWHFLGHLQSNKVKKTRHNRFRLIHSVDSVKLAQCLSEDNEAQQTVQPVLFQVNLTRDPQKSGFLIEEITQATPLLADLKGIDPQGLMTIGPNPPEPEASLQCFKHLRLLRDQLHDHFGSGLSQLSMGMSQDFTHALDCGATIIRIGSGIFGS